MALLSSKRRDLDAWAVTLGVNNDDDAIAELRRLFARVDDAAEELRAVYVVVNGGPNDAAAGHLTGAFARSVQAASALLEVLQAFQRHERGR